MESGRLLRPRILARFPIETPRECVPRLNVHQVPALHFTARNIFELEVASPSGTTHEDLCLHILLIYEDTWIWNLPQLSVHPSASVATLA